MYMDHVIDRMADIYKKTFPVRLKKIVYRFAVSESLLLFNSVIGV